jgi:hypothetical protein
VDTYSSARKHNIYTVMFPEWDIQLKKVQLHRQIVDAWPDRGGQSPYLIHKLRSMVKKLGLHN